MLKNIAIPVQNLFLLAFKKKNANYTAMNKFVIINRENSQTSFSRWLQASYLIIYKFNFTHI